jgi:hypothetical protein
VPGGRERGVWTESAKGYREVDRERVVGKRNMAREIGTTAGKAPDSISVRGRDWKKRQNYRVRGYMSLRVCMCVCEYVRCVNVCECVRVRVRMRRGLAVPGVLPVDSNHLPIRLALVDHTQNAQDLDRPHLSLRVRVRVRA